MLARTLQVEDMYNKEHEHWAKQELHSFADNYELSHAKAADEATLKEEIHNITEHIHTKYKLLQSAFRQFDADHSGTLSPFELEQAVKHFNLPIPHEHIMQIAERCADEDGQIDYAHFCQTLHEKDSDNPEYFLHGSKAVAYDHRDFHKEGTWKHHTK
jgi:hypothetical protein